MNGIVTPVFEISPICRPSRTFPFMNEGEGGLLDWHSTESGLQHFWDFFGFFLSDSFFHGTRCWKMFIAKLTFQLKLYYKAAIYSLTSIGRRKDQVCILYSIIVFPKKSYNRGEICLRVQCNQGEDLKYLFQECNTETSFVECSAIEQQQHRLKTTVCVQEWVGQDIAFVFIGTS